MTGPIQVRAWVPCAPGNEMNAVPGNGLCFAIETIRGNLDKKVRPTLLVMLHGDVSRGGPADYHIRRLRHFRNVKNFIFVGMIRPGYYDSKKRTSQGSNYKRRDNYTSRYILAIGEAIKNLKKLHNARRVVLVGHSGGAAITGVLIGQVHGLVDKAVLISCPCDIERWRRLHGRRAWRRSMSPSWFVSKVRPSTEVIAITGWRDHNTFPQLAGDYIAALKKRGLKAKFIIVSEAGHNLSSRLWQKAVSVIFP
jgi:pimeloyl-ACP methyl ester carboxylesterase